MSLPARYTQTAILLHWLIALVIVVNFALAFIAEAVAEGASIMLLHKSLGISLIGLILMRILWRATHRPPAYPSRYAAWERGLANAVHGALYLVMLAVPIAGYLVDNSGRRATSLSLDIFGVIPIPRIPALVEMEPLAKAELHHLFEEIHELGAWVLVALVLLHIAGALKHQLIDREPAIQRILP